MDIPQAYWDMYNQTVNDMINKHFRTVCSVVYGNHRTECPNCLINPITGSSINVYKSGGPQPFQDSVCPYCNGEGYVLTQNSESINTRAYFTSKDFIKVPNLPINAPDGMVQIITFLQHMPKLQQCVEIVVNTQLDNFAHYRYNLISEIIPWGLGPDKIYCISHWSRNQ